MPNFMISLRDWEGYDPSLSDIENYIELQLYMGFMEEAKIILWNIAQHKN